jgi:hypothetical protein
MNLLDALQATLAGEHAAVYGYGIVGAQVTSAADLRAARAGYDAHRARRAALVTLVSSNGGQPVAADPAYDVGGPVTTPARARALAGRIEAAAAGPYADLVAAADGALRTAAAGWLRDAAVRGAGWTGTAEAFPGLTGRLPSAG